MDDVKVRWLCALLVGTAVAVAATSVAIAGVHALLSPMVECAIYVAAGVAVVLYIGHHGVHAQNLFRRSDRPLSYAVLAGVTIVLMLFSAGAVLGLFNTLHLLWPQWVEGFPNPDLGALSEGGVAGVVAGVVSAVILAPILEEGVRVLVLHRWERKWGISSAVLTSSAVFGLLHADVVGGLVFGIGMSMLYMRFETVWAPVIVHAAFNATALTGKWWYPVGTEPGSAWQIGSSLSWALALAFMAAGTGLAWISLRAHMPPCPWVLPEFEEQRGSHVT